MVAGHSIRAQNPQEPGAHRGDWQEFLTFLECQEGFTDEEIHDVTIRPHLYGEEYELFRRSGGIT